METTWVPLLTRVMCDSIVRAPAAYLVGQTKCNASSVVERGAEILRRGVVAKLFAVRKSGDNRGYCGYDHIAASLEDRGITADEVQPVDYDEGIGALNTLTELVSLVRHARQNKLRRIILIASPFHQLRSFMSAVTVVDREYPALAVYNCVGAPLPWNEVAVHSQGELVRRRDELIMTELDSIKCYQVQSEPYLLISVERALEYLDRRDTAHQ